LKYLQFLFAGKRGVASEKFPKDADIGALYAESLMNLRSPPTACAHRGPCTGSPWTWTGFRFLLVQPARIADGFVAAPLEVMNRALIEALAARYADPLPKDTRPLEI
jgi:hypothetical protein